MAKKIMIQGTMSSAGKSLIAAGLCRIFKEDGYRVAPFKSQNMALNSFITDDGLEMGRAQVMQAEAAGIKPTVDMNPILLKPTSDKGSQVIVQGEVMADMSAREYFKHKLELVPVIKESFARLEKEYDIIVIEGAGSPAEINLKQNDIVNMGIAKMFDASVLLVGDIDRGGVFAQLIGTLMLLPEDEKDRVKGLIINKFRGDKTILDPGIEMLEGMCGKRVCGTVPYMNIKLDDEDSLTERFSSKMNDRAMVDIAVIRLPHISNFTDFDVFDSVKGCHVRYVENENELGFPDMIIIPGSKNTIYDMLWLRENGLEAAVKYLSRRMPVFGICGGFQMLGQKITDEIGVDAGRNAQNTSSGDASRNIKIIRGMGLLPIETVMQPEKTRKQVVGKLPELEGMFSNLSGKEYAGYEIHMGESYLVGAEQEAVGGRDMVSEPEAVDGRDVVSEPEAVGGRDIAELTEQVVEKEKIDRSREIDSDHVIIQKLNVYGTYVHGIFDGSDIAVTLVRTLARKKGIELPETEETAFLYADFKEKQYSELARILRENMDMEYIYSIL
ncbi:MAG: cobyric acid synthase [Eubacterium sp.]|nr:cobyric acid synthase [Eubacterium sp.]